MPKLGCVKKFTNYQNTLKMNFCLYCDTECLLEPIDLIEKDAHWGSMRKLSRHISFAVSAYLDVSKDMQEAMLNSNLSESEFFPKNKLAIFRGRDCMTQLMQHIYEVAASVQQINDLVSTPMRPDAYWWAKRATEEKCWFCAHPLSRSKGGEKIVLHHDHCSSEILRVCHQSCNV